jgi:hypothetical protein
MEIQLSEMWRWKDEYQYDKLKVLRRVKEKNILYKINFKKTNWTGHTRSHHV